MKKLAFFPRFSLDFFLESFSRIFSRKAAKNGVACHVALFRRLLLYHDCAPGAGNDLQPPAAGQGRGSRKSLD
jgi:hypothetical protein